MTSLTERQFTQLNWHVNDHLLIDFKPDTQCYIYNSTLTANVSAKERSFFYENLAFELLTQTDKPGLSQLLCSMQHRDFLLDNVHHYLTQTHNAFQQKAFQEAAYYLVKLIGIGIGLTPSGDDFLCGVLAALYNLGFQQTIFYKHLSEEIEKQLNRTNDISAAFLHCALQHQYAEFIINFFAVDEQISLVQKQKLLQSFKNIGHSSGIDTLFGIYFITNLLNNLNISVFY
ncbi:DUF2877 domain-containing protein [Cricetibacter osteomyelitidis]|nr:DUF2877 domain-containing protein [Cricetibacter osteomyelitidis]